MKRSYLGIHSTEKKKKKWGMQTRTFLILTFFRKMVLTGGSYKQNGEATSITSILTTFDILLLKRK